MALYVGNERGDIIVAYLTHSELATLSGEDGGCLPSQRGTNHNPYRTVHVKLAPHEAKMSLHTAVRKQKLAAEQALSDGR